MNNLPGGLTDAELRALSADKQIDLLVVLEQQRRRVEAAQGRLLAVMQAGDDSELNLVQEEVSLALQVPVRTAQLRLAQATTLVSELPRTLAAVADGALSAGHANVLAEAVWRLPADRPGLPGALEQRVLPSVLAAGTVTVRQLQPGGPPTPATTTPGRQRIFGTALVMSSPSAQTGTPTSKSRRTARSPSKKIRRRSGDQADLLQVTG